MSAQSVQSSLSVSQGSPTALSQSGLGNLTIENTALDQYYEKWPKDFFQPQEVKEWSALAQSGIFVNFMGNF